MNIRRPDPTRTAESELRAALGACRSSFLAAGFFSLFINLLLLVPSIYMLQVYDRVLSSGSQSTLMMLTLIAVFLYLIMGALEWVRSQILVVTSTRFDQMLSGRVFDALFVRTLTSGGRASSAQPLNDLITLRQFLTGQGLFGFFDAPWMPIYVLVMFLFHPYFGVTAIVSAAILLALTVWNEVATRTDLQQANREALEASQFTQQNLRNAEVIEAMGMMPRLRSRWADKQGALLMLQGRASEKGGLIASLSKTFRLTLQSLVLALGAYLAIHNEITPGLVIAGSILLGRALAPLDQIIAAWRGFLGARESYHRLDGLLRILPPTRAPMVLPAPRGEIVLERAVVTPPGASSPVLKGLSMLIEAGSVLAVIGPSAAGKSTLVRTILGLHVPVSGTVRLDGAELSQWNREQLGPHIGYLPQDVELLDGTVAENIARFEAIDSAKVVTAAEAAGVHQMIVRLPEGYETPIAGQSLSAGQRQRLGLARALYGNPQVIVLDEPNSNLDREGDAAFLNTLSALQQARKTVIVITHRNNVLNQVDKILLLVDGQIALYGPRDEVLSSLQRTAGSASAGSLTQRTVPAPR